MELRRRYSWILLALVGVWLTLAVADAADPGTHHKLRVADRELVSQLVRVGGQVVADYGSYCLVEVDAAAAAVLRGDDRVEERDDFDRIQLNTGVIDTTTATAKAARKAVGRFAGRKLHLVQFAGPVQTAWHAALQQCGVEVVTYVPSNAYLVYGDAESLTRLQGWAGGTKVVQWDGPYRDEYKLHRKSRAPVAAADLYAIQLVADPGANRGTLKLIDQLRAGPIRLQYSLLRYVNVIVPMTADAVAQIVSQPDVISIQPYGVPRKICERQCQIVAGNLSGDQPTGPGYLAWLTSVGFTQAQFSNSAFAVDVSDSGIDDGTTSPNHFGLYTLGKTKQASRVIYNRLVGTPNAGSSIQGCDGHGTIDAHIIAGYEDTNDVPFVDYAGYHPGLGVAPFVKVGSSVIFDPSEYTFPNFANLQSQAYHDGARISNNSWGDPTNGFYSVDSQAYDALVRDAQPTGSTYPVASNQEMVIVFAAGNITGPTDIYAPGTAKNVITVGASENVQVYQPSDYSGFDGSLVDDFSADSADDIADFSCLGPVADGRMKPDLVAPGTHVSGGVIQAQNPAATGTADICFTDLANLFAIQISGGDLLANQWPFWPDFQEFYSASSGTSHAAPAVSGAAALLRQYFINLGLAPASPAMTKAFLMNSARYLTGVGAGDDLWSGSQGMGGVNLGTAFDGIARLLRDQAATDKFTASGQSRTFSGTISTGSKPFRVTVAWTDTPGSTTGNAWNNDLDLTVTVGGQTYKGNVFSGALSTAGGAYDPRNNVESVFLPAGTTGSFSVTVLAANINSDGVPNNAELLDQDFALVIYNAIGGVSPDSAALVSEGCNPGNTNLDPGETDTLQLGLRNLGAVNTTNLVATLLATGGVTSPSGAQTYGVLVAGGTNVTKAYTFTATGVCGSNVTATLQLQDGAADLGTAVFTFPLGAPATTASVYSYTGSTVAIPDNNAAGAEIALVVSGFVGDITDLNFAFEGTTCTGSNNGLNHTYVGDLIATLTSPGGTTVTLMNRPGPGDQGSSGANFCHTVLDDEGSTPIESITGAGAPYTGTYTPVEFLAAFDGENPNGTWTLNVSDNSADDTGDVRAFSLRIYGRQCCGSVAGDSDGDNLPDTWETQYFGNLNQAGTGDFDGDGISNLAEYQAGTIPTNTLSGLHITSIIRQGSDLKLTWQTAGGHTNIVQIAPAVTGTFANVGANIILPGSGDTSTNYVDPGAATNTPARFYRIRLVP